MNSLFSRMAAAGIRFSFCTKLTRFDGTPKLKKTSSNMYHHHYNYNNNLTLKVGGHCYYYSTTSSIGITKSKSKKTKKLVVDSSKTAAMNTIMEEDKNGGFFVVRKGDIVGVYNSLTDCQAQVGSSVCDPPVSVYKGYAMPKGTEAYLQSHGLKDALYSIRAVDLTEELFGRLVPCLFQHPPPISIGEPQRTFQEALASQTGRSCILEFDGACKGNPGPSGAGAVLRSPDGILRYT
ncbi:uncharacterized protein [Rutidosis leptorrhynchoides]|uniref:uncharacterized protein n=1 Tax=Rutidosis leptorrhynchoides TaxID=125765 RepID=UPI003A995DA5